MDGCGVSGVNLQSAGHQRGRCWVCERKREKDPHDFLQPALQGRMTNGDMKSLFSLLTSSALFLQTIPRESAHFSADSLLQG